MFWPCFFSVSCFVWFSHFLRTWIHRSFHPVNSSSRVADVSGSSKAYFQRKKNQLENLIEMILEEQSVSSSSYSQFLFFPMLLLRGNWNMKKIITLSKSAMMLAFFWNGNGDGIREMSTLLLGGNSVTSAIRSSLISSSRSSIGSRFTIEGSFFVL